MSAQEIHESGGAPKRSEGHFLLESRCAPPETTGPPPPLLVQLEQWTNDATTQTWCLFHMQEHTLAFHWLGQRDATL